MRSKKSPKVSKVPPHPHDEISSGGLRALASWFGRQKRVLPWRDDPSLYRVWVSEIMLQQTQVITVVPYFERFLRAFPTVDALAACSEDEVMREWAGLGYYSRARNLRKGAQAIVARPGRGDARFPRTREGWLEIPGVGEYTAGAILSIALDQIEAIVDGNVERVFSRLRKLSRRTLGETPYKEKLWQYARETVSDASSAKIPPSVVNQAWMELGATVCTPKKPMCRICPLRSECKSFFEGAVEDYPERKKPKEWIQIQESRVAILSADLSSVRLVKGNAGEWRAGLWDFVKEMPGAVVVEKLGAIDSKHVVTRHKITRRTEVVRLKTAKAGERLPGQWVSVRAPEVALGSAPKKVLQSLIERYL